MFYLVFVGRGRYIPAQHGGAVRTIDLAKEVPHHRCTCSTCGTCNTRKSKKEREECVGREARTLEEDVGGGGVFSTKTYVTEVLLRDDGMTTSTTTTKSIKDDIIYTRGRASSNPAR